MNDTNVENEDSWPLTEVEPSPIEDTPQESRHSYFPETKEESPEPLIKRFISLGFAKHGLPFYLTRTQKYSSYTFTVFATLHIANTSIIPLVMRSVPDASTYLLLTRPFYQTFPLEPLLIGLPLAAHIISGVWLRVYRRKQNVRRYGSLPLSQHESQARPSLELSRWPRVSGTSALGFALVPLVAGHAFVTRGLPLLRLGDSSTIGLEYVAHGFARHPRFSFVGLTVLVGVATWHGVWGWMRWLRLTPGEATEQHVRKKRWYLANATCALLAGLWLAGGLGVVGCGGEAGGWLGREYDDLYQSIPVVGSWSFM